MKTQLCLLSGELMPNVIGVLHERPERVIPVVTSQSARQVEHLEAALRAAGCVADLQDPVTVLPYNLVDCGKAIGNAVSSKNDLTINWTGGTKIMSYAAGISQKPNRREPSTSTPLTASCLLRTTRKPTQSVRSYLIRRGWA